MDVKQWWEINPFLVKESILSFLPGYDSMKAIRDVNSTFKPSICVITSDTILIIINLFATGEHAISVSLMLLDDLI